LTAAQGAYIDKATRNKLDEAVQKTSNFVQGSRFKVQGSRLKEISFLRYTEIALRFPDGGAGKRVSERKLRLQEPPEARKLAFACRRSAKALMDFLSAKIPAYRDKQLFTGSSNRNPHQ